MKKLIMALAILAFFAAGVSASEPYTAYLLTEGDDPTLETCEAHPAQYTTVYLRLWITNDIAKGLTGFELGIDFDSGDMISVTKNPGIPSIIGDLTTTAFAGAFQLCQGDEWVWIAQYEDFYLGVPHMIYTVPNSDTGNYIVTSCETNFPQYPLTEGNQFGVNMSCVVDAEEESWGAVKSMYR
jgi:hypothetical protein